MTALIHLHPAICAIAAYWVFSSAVGGMTTPTTSNSQFYTWLYNFLHLLAGNITAAVQQRFPDLPAGSKLTQQSSTTLEAPNAPK